LQDYSHLIDIQEEPDAASFNGRGQVYAELGEYELALKDLETAVKLARTSSASGLPYSLSGLGKTLTGLVRYEEAEAAFRESLSIRPDNAWLHFNRGLLYLAKDDHRSAGFCFELALRLDNPRLSPRKRVRAEAFVAKLNGR
jgi:tetratricopeptide (TPR) repeat protein